MIYIYVRFLYVISFYKIKNIDIDYYNLLGSYVISCYKKYIALQLINYYNVLDSYVISFCKI